MVLAGKIGCMISNITTNGIIEKIHTGGPIALNNGENNNNCYQDCLQKKVSFKNWTKRDFDTKTVIVSLLNMAYDTFLTLEPYRGSEFDTKCRFYSYIGCLVVPNMTSAPVSACKNQFCYISIYLHRLHLAVICSQ